jgi:hypothetical protein
LVTDIKTREEILLDKIAGYDVNLSGLTPPVATGN